MKYSVEYVKIEFEEMTNSINEIECTVGVIMMSAGIKDIYSKYVFLYKKK